MDPVHDIVGEIDFENFVPGVMILGRKSIKRV
jgi:hypothetical protein